MQQQYPVVEFTVELARQLLVGNKINRRIKPRMIDRYAAAMSEGNWPFSGGTIITDDQGVLLDGQHRLLAIIKSGKPQKFILIGNLPRSIFDVLDTGAVRKASDVIHQVGEYGSSAMTASAAKYLFIYEQTGEFDRNNALVRNRLTNRQILNTVSRYPELADRQRELNSWLNSSGVTGVRRGLLLALYVAMLMKDEPLAKKFFRRICVGEELLKTDIEYMLRRRFLNKKERLEERDTIGLVVKAWNSVRKAQPLRKLQLGEGEKIPEIF